MVLFQIGNLTPQSRNFLQQGPQLDPSFGQIPQPEVPRRVRELQR
jgi:hypothetical protein